MFNKIVEKAHKQSFLPVPFYRALKKETGLNYKTLYLNSLQSLAKKNIKSDKKPLNKRKNKTFTSLLYPTEISDNKIVVFKRGLRKLPGF